LLRELANDNSARGINQLRELVEVLGHYLSAR
jgi:hypothetical protein